VQTIPLDQPRIQPNADWLASMGRYGFFHHGV
jgi:hypothetical protein